ESNSNYAQGGIACVMDPVDQFEKHIDDSLIAGAGLCNQDIVEMIVKEGPARIRELIEWGVDFTQQENGQWALGREGGHSERRILHVKDMTGRAIEAALVKATAAHPRITVREHVFAIDLITEHKLRQSRSKQPSRVLGLYALNVHENRVEALAAKTVILATGGAGHVYLYTTNPGIATGDGVAMGYRAGAQVRDLEFMQFHPTALYTTNRERFLISEAVRGEGAILRNSAHEAFMHRYHPQADLAPRDIVARAIDAEMKTSGAMHVWLDLSAHPWSYWQERFPTIIMACQRQGIDPAQPWIPVVPAAHYLCGGLVTDKDARTSVPGLFACGEVACTGLHGANRLASNSLLEAVVMAHRGAQAAYSYMQEVPASEVPMPPWIDGDLQDSDERVVLSHNLDELKRTMWDYVGIVRTPKRLERAHTRIRNLSKEITEYYWNFKLEPSLLELRNLVLIAELMVQAAASRKESCGLHYILQDPLACKGSVEKLAESALTT
ncbi:MAG TPA: L-aspartate oxidase, partial [Opitutales bacterium]|nr:L-aspartate oxidase [Opitutales bacterium]